MELEYFEYLINFRISIEHWLFLNKFSENATNCPNVYSQTILLLAKKNFGSSIPESLNFVSQCLDGDSESASKSKVSNFKISSSIDKKILGFKIPVDNSTRVAVVDPVDELI